MCHRAQRRFWHIVSSASSDHYYSLLGFLERVMEQIRIKHTILYIKPLHPYLSLKHYLKCRGRSGFWFCFFFEKKKACNEIKAFHTFNRVIHSFITNYISNITGF